MYKETVTKDVVNFKTADASVIGMVGIVSILGSMIRFLLTFWEGESIESSGGGTAHYRYHRRNFSDLADDPWRIVEYLCVPCSSV